MGAEAHVPTGTASIVRWMLPGSVVKDPRTFADTFRTDPGLRRPAPQQHLGGSHGAHSDQSRNSGTDRCRCAERKEP